jgi:hypothetical protein
MALVGEKTLSKNKLYVVEAFNRGYRMIDGNCISPFGKNLKLFKSGFYLQFGVHINGKKRAILCHHMMAYQKFKEKWFDSECVRHLNGNCHDNREDNIEIGTLLQNSLDIPFEKRIKNTQKAREAKNKTKTYE